MANNRGKKGERGGERNFVSACQTRTALVNVKQRCKGWTGDMTDLGSVMGLLLFFSDLQKDRQTENGLIGGE